MSSTLSSHASTPAPADTATEPVRRRRWPAVVALTLLGLLVAVVVAYNTFTNAERTVVVGAHTATVTPTFDGYATLDFGSILPRIRMAVDAPADVGVHLAVGDTQADSLEQLIARDAVIASQPQAEIDQISGVVTDIAVASVVRGLGVGLAVVIALVAAWVLVGRRRRAEIARGLRGALRRRRLAHAPLRTMVAFALAMVLAAVLLNWPEPQEQTASEVRWRPLIEVYPEVPDNPQLAQLEISSGSATDASRAIVESAIKTYDASVTFYGEMVERVPEIAEQLRKPEDGQTVALLVSDRHDNVGMDAVVGAVAREADVSLVIDAGDDTSTGASWEGFSIRSLGREFRDVPVVAVAGNHDSGPYVVEEMANQGFEILDGDPVDVEGIRFLGFSDPRSSGFTAGWTQGGTSIREQGEELTKIACEDGDVSTVVVHSPTTGEELAKAGCVDLIVSGHLHVQRGPTVVAGENGRPTVTFTNASTGGAAFAFALGSKLRRPAQATLITYEDGRPVGLQPVNFSPDGSIEVADFVPVDLTALVPTAPEPTDTEPTGTEPTDTELTDTEPTESPETPTD